MNNDISEKLKEIKEAAQSPEAMAEYWVKMEAKLLEEMNLLVGKSPEELLQYNAENRIMIMEMQYQLNIHVEMIQQQQKYIDLLAYTVNQLIGNQKPKGIDLSKWVVKGDFKA